MRALEEFFEAAREGDVLRLSRTPEFVRLRRDRATALHIAALNGKTEAADWLLGHGADVNALDGEFHATPLSWATEKGHLAMVTFLIEKGASINIWQAVAIGYLDHVRQLLEADPGLVDDERDFGTIVHQACFWGQVDVLECLIANGADLGFISQHGFTPLQVAERQARDARTHTPIVMLERKAEIERNCRKIADRLRTLTGAAA